MSASVNASANSKMFVEVSTLESIQLIQNLCRVCVSGDHRQLEPLVPLQDGGLADMYTTFTAIDISQEPYLSKVCKECKAEIVRCYEFRSKCIKSDHIIKSLYKERCVKEEANIYKREPTQSISEAFSEIRHDEDFEITDIQYLDEGLIDEDEPCKDENTEMDNKIKMEIVQSEKINHGKIVSNQKVKGRHYACSTGNKKFKKIKALQNHMDKHERESQTHGCGQCKAAFTTAHDLQLHSSVHAKGPVWTCPNCEKEYNSRTVFRRHVRRHMVDKRHRCDRCGKGFAEHHALRRHQRVHSGQPAPRDHACHLCSKRFTESGLLTAHMTRHTGELPYECTVCDKRFPSARLLASHVIVHSDHKSHACHVCDRRFRHYSTLTTHLRTHTGEKPYVCSVCGKTFIQNSNLTRHMRTHTGERPYTCSVCSQRFKSGSTLKAHVRIHTGEKPYSCELCGKRFARLDVRAHLRRHAGERGRGHACAACPKAFASAARLRDHTRLHTGERPYECAMCPQKYPTKSHLVKHLKTHETKKKPKQKMVMVDIEPFPDKLVYDTVEIDSHKDIGEEVPLEVTGELVLQENGEIKTELLVVDEQNTSVMVDGFVSSEFGEDREVKLYQLDQSLLQIHSAGGQLTISQLTSKMTHNF